MTENADVIPARRRPGRTRRLVAGAAVLLAVLAAWLLARPLPEIEQHRRHFAELQRQMALARETRTTRAGDRARVMRLRAQARTAGEGQRAAFGADASALEARLGWGDSSVVRAAVLGRPFISFVRTTDLPDAPPASSLRGNGCLACHLAIASPGYEKYPAPFRTHPDLAGYVGAASPHPPSRVRCASCHLGDDRAATFADAGHTTLRREADTAPTGHHWADTGASGAMLPVGRVEAACGSCHEGEVYQPGAPRLNEALVTLERGGCYACHDVAGMNGVARRGPDLRRIGAKLSPEWVKAWLADPRAIKPATWMPRFWTAGTLSPEDRAAIDAVTAFLFAASEPYTPATPNPPRGDASRGKAVVESVGCLGCHIVGDVRRDNASVRRTFGQPLEALGSKTTSSWLFDWVRDPSRYSPGTRMPNFRLDTQDAADVAAYLTTLGHDTPTVPAANDADDEPYRAVIRRYGDPVARESADGRTLSGAPLREFAGRTVISALGCFNCHETGSFEGQRRTVPMARRPVWLDAEARAVHATPAARATGAHPMAAPDLGLGETEASRLALALTAVAGAPREAHGMTMPWHLVKATGRTLMQERNCVGCHAVDGTGGDFVSLVADPSLGPPLLTPEGSRVQPAWLGGFLRQPRTIRPWLSVRMPTFGLSDDDAAKVGDYLRAIAPPNPEPVPAPPGATAAAGKELFDLLKCQQCHVLGSIPADQPTSNLAPDLRTAHERLQPEWILAWLRNPSAILPGTRMPTFWPDYPKSYYPPLDRNAAAQIRAIREHVVGLR